ncbi:MAG: alanine--tRNA ligase [Chloroflexi bacterium]|nr:alanine--tRNA ligase [Chloroflexota bacterium]
MEKKLTGADIRQSFIDYFVKQGHTFVPSSSLVPGGDATLLFTNAGMVQFKDVFLGTDHRAYSRAVNSQKCMRVAGKHNDLDDVGRDNTHHTFFEMLGNWSFGDYYKKEAITWAWDLLTNVWGIDRNLLWATCFKDEYGEIPDDSEAKEVWLSQPGMPADHVVFSGRKDNFWEMADTGPCGPCSEIHIDLGPQHCDKKDDPNHVCRVNGDCKRYLELWNLVFIQYNRKSPTELEPLPARHVDTGMGFERIVSVLQGKQSNYETDLLSPSMDMVMELTGDSVEERAANLTPYRVIADHSRSASFLIADGVIPGNTGRNYICRMIIRRAARFGSKIGLNEPFLAQVAEKVIETYGEAYPELVKNREIILSSLTREEKRFKRTVEAGLTYLNELVAGMKTRKETVLDGKEAFELYATHGLPLELTRDILREQNLDVDESGFRAAMEEHRIASGGGKAMGALGGEDADLFREVFEDLQANGKVSSDGIAYDPYHDLNMEGEVLALVKEGAVVSSAKVGETVSVILPRSIFYIESGGQVNDTGKITSLDGSSWEIEVEDVRRPAAGVVVHVGKVVKGEVNAGDMALAAVDVRRRRNIMRNHTATHLLHSALHKVLGTHARQAGSLVAPDRLRFDFTHPDAISAEQLEKIEADVNAAIQENHTLQIVWKSLDEALQEGAMALFGEKYGERVRTISIGNTSTFSYELCGGTHVEKTGDIGMFLITAESSAAAGIRRIEAVTGEGAYELVHKRLKALKQTANLLESSVDEVPEKAQIVLKQYELSQKEVGKYKQQQIAAQFKQYLDAPQMVKGVSVVAAILEDADADTLRQMTDRFRDHYASGVVLLGSVIKEKPMLIAAVTDDLVKRGLSAGNLVKSAAEIVGGSGGGRPVLAQAGGKDASKLPQAIQSVVAYIENALK